MPSLWFVVPVHGRQELARICLNQLRRTCDALQAQGVEASAVVVGEDLAAARELGFATVRRNNRFLSAKFNDGIQFATDPDYNPRPADYVVPCGSDDWVDWRCLLPLPPRNTVVGFQAVSFVREDGREIVTKYLNYRAGAGIRIYPRHLMEAVEWRPADEDRKRGCDTSILTNLSRYNEHLTVEHRRTTGFQIVDWKTPGQNVTPFDALSQHKTLFAGDPFEVLADTFPADALEEMRALYDRELVAA